jgi:hypothetical protein
MSEKIVLFPTLLVSKSEFGVTNNRLEKDVHQYGTKDELANLREAFDLARENWPVEMPELPEENKRYSLKK